MSTKFICDGCSEELVGSPFMVTDDRGMTFHFHAGGLCLDRWLAQEFPRKRER